MNTELFTRWLQTEAEILYHRDISPASFIQRAKPLIEALAKEKAIEVISEKDLMTLLGSKNQEKTGKELKRSTNYEIVDLCLFRAN